MDFTIAKTPAVAAGLTVLMAAVFALACALSRIKWILLLGRGHPQDPHVRAAVSGGDSQGACHGASAVSDADGFGVLAGGDAAAVGVTPYLQFVPAGQAATPYLCTVSP